MKRHFLVWLLIAAALLGVALYAALKPAGGGSRKALPMVGYLAPDFELKDLSGRRHRLSDYRGKVVFLNFWASW